MAKGLLVKQLAKIDTSLTKTWHWKTTSYISINFSYQQRSRTWRRSFILQLRNGIYYTQEGKNKAKHILEEIFRQEDGFVCFICQSIKPSDRQDNIIESLEGLKKNTSFEVVRYLCTF